MKFSKEEWGAIEGNLVAYAEANKAIPEDSFRARLKERFEIIKEMPISDFYSLMANIWATQPNDDWDAVANALGLPPKGSATPAQTQHADDLLRFFVDFGILAFTVAEMRKTSVN